MRHFQRLWHPAKAMGVKAGELIKKLLESGVMVTINQVLDADTVATHVSELAGIDAALVCVPTQQEGHGVVLGRRGTAATRSASALSSRSAV